MKRLFALAVLLLAASAAPAQHWEFEQVDVAGWGQSWLALEHHPDGRCFVAYDGADTRFRVAVKDSAWSYIDTAVSARIPVRSFALSPFGGWGVAYLDSAWRICLLERHDSLWSVRTSAFEPVWGEVPLAYDTLGNAMLLCNTDFGYYGVARVTLGDTWETVDTVLWDPSPYMRYAGLDIAVGPDNQPWALCAGGYSFPCSGPPHDPPWSDNLYLLHVTSGGWESEWLGGGTMVSLTAMSLAAGVGTATTCHRESGGLDPDYYSRFSCNGDSLDTLAWRAGLAIDAAGRLMLAYTRPGELTFMLRDQSGWHRLLVATATDAGSLVEVSMDSLGQPVIAYSTPDGIWLAHGVDIVGVEEPRPAPEAASSLIPTIARGVLNLQSPISNPQSPMVLMDACGRRVLDLHAGENDISHLSPGVYFIHSRVASRHSQPATRVVVLK